MDSHCITTPYETISRRDGELERWISLEGVAQEEADFAAGVALFAVPLVSLAQPVEFWFDLPDAGQLLTLLLTVEIRTGELVSNGLRPGERTEGEQSLTHAYNAQTPKIAGSAV